MQYQEFEERLIRFSDVSPDDLPGFRARLRNLMKFGAVNKPGVGKGSRLTFDDDDVWEMAVALSFVELGLSPTRIRVVMEHVRGLRDRRPEFAVTGNSWLQVSFRSNVAKVTDDPAYLEVEVEIVSPFLVRGAVLFPSGHININMNAIEEKLAR